MAQQLPDLPYDYSALEPVIDAQTMKLHHDMHHAAYVKNLNAALEKYPNLQSKSAEDLIRDLNALPEDIRSAVRNNLIDVVEKIGLRYFRTCCKRPRPPKKNGYRCLENLHRPSLPMLRCQFRSCEDVQFQIWFAIRSEAS